MNSQLITLSELVSQRFYDAVFNSLDVRTSTITDYKYRISHFHSFVNTNGVDYNLLLSYKRSLESREDYSISTKNKYLATAMVFLRQCKELGFIDTQLNCQVSLFSQSKAHKKFGISESEAEQICQWISQNPEKCREILILSLLLFQGLRQAEICNIKWNDIKLSERTIFIRGKGRDDRDPVHLHPNTIKAIQNYQVSVGYLEGYLFTSRSRHSARSKLTERGLRFIVKAILAELCIDKDVHGFRHYFTTHLIRMMPGELTRVAQFTRHRSLEMLTVYNDSLLDEENNAQFDSAFAPIH